MQARTGKELLDDYATDWSDAAFAEQVARYYSLVYRACLRVLGDARDAEEAGGMPN